MLCYLKHISFRHAIINIYTILRYLSFYLGTESFFQNFLCVLLVEWKITSNKLTFNQRIMLNFKPRLVFAFHLSKNFSLRNSFFSYILIWTRYIYYDDSIHRLYNLHLHYLYTFVDKGKIEIFCHVAGLEEGMRGRTAQRYHGTVYGGQRYGAVIFLPTLLPTDILIGYGFLTRTIIQKISLSSHTWCK